MNPPLRGCRSTRRPFPDSPELFWYEAQGVEEEIARYPALVGTGEYFRESHNENWPEDSEGDTADSGWRQFTGEVDQERFYH